MQEREELLRYVAERYGTAPEYPWEADPVSAVLRHADNRKWYGVFLRARGTAVGRTDAAPVDILNVKCDPALSAPLRAQDGIFPAYHMNKRLWLTALLDGTVAHDTLIKLVDMSYALTAPRNRAGKKATK